MHGVSRRELLGAGDGFTLITQRSGGSDPPPASTYKISTEEQLNSLSLVRSGHAGTSQNINRGRASGYRISGYGLLHDAVRVHDVAPLRRGRARVPREDSKLRFQCAEPDHHRPAAGYRLEYCRSVWKPPVETGRSHAGDMRPLAALPTLMKEENH